jgi:hypothetical protein
MIGDKNAQFGETSERTFNNLHIGKLSYPNGTQNFGLRATKNADANAIELAATPAELANEFRLIVKWLETML